MTSRSASPYNQVKNPNPVFSVSEDKGTLPFCRKLMAKAEGFTSRFDFLMHVAFSRSIGKRFRKPPVLRCRAIDALLQAMCFHYDPLANRVAPSTTTLAIECGLATESKAGNLSITRVTRALKSLAEDFGLITYSTEYDPTIGCYVPSDIQFTPALFDSLDVSEEAVAAARRSRFEYQNKQRERKGEVRLELEEMTSKAFGFVRERFRQYHRERRQHGIKLRRARRDSERSRKEIEIIVKRELTREVADRRFPADKAAVFNEVARRVKERMMLSRGNYTRLSPS